MHEYPDGTKIFMAKVHELYDNTINWRLNRPPDEKKVKEIADYYEKNTDESYMDGMVMINYIKGQGYVRFDGNHRIEAGVQIKRELMVIGQLFFLSEEKLREKFVQINKSNPCPSFYISDDTSIEYKLITDDIVTALTKKYPKFFSSSARPRIPNINRDNLKDELFFFLKDRKMTLTKDDIICLFYRYNEKLGNDNFVRKKISEKIMEKCDRYGCYLFLDKNFISSSLLEEEN